MQQTTPQGSTVDDAGPASRSGRTAGMTEVHGAEPSEEKAAMTTPETTVAGNPSRWWLGVAVGAVVAFPLSWLLYLAASLPFFIGLFFFALFGLIIGASCFRVASSGGRRYGSGPVLAGTTLLVLGTWIASIYFEAGSIGTDMAAEAIRIPGIELHGATSDEFKANVAGEVRQYITENYPPGGTVGYLRWATDSGMIPEGSLASVPSPLGMNQRGYWLFGRLVISGALLAFGVASQTLSLRKRNDPEPASS